MGDSSEKKYDIEYNDLSELTGTIPFNYESLNRQPVQINYEELYKTQLKEMENLGFRDREHNLLCLRRAMGNLNNAVSLLFDFD
jgi:hypothetical protein